MAQPVQAQNPAMSLMGNAQSNSQAPLPGAAVTVIDLPSGVRHAAATDAAGRFMVANLMVGGPYLIRVGEGGYRPQTVMNTSRNRQNCQFHCHAGQAQRGTLLRQ